MFSNRKSGDFRCRVQRNIEVLPLRIRKQVNDREVGAGAWQDQSHRPDGRAIDSMRGSIENQEMAGPGIVVISLPAIRIFSHLFESSL
jgi:hypothetical protein